MTDPVALMFAWTGAQRAFGRLDVASPYDVVECAYWLGSAAEAMDRHTDGDILSAFY